MDQLREKNTIRRKKGKIKHMINAFKKHDEAYF